MLIRKHFLSTFQTGNTDKQGRECDYPSYEGVCSLPGPLPFPAQPVGIFWISTRLVRTSDFGAHNVWTWVHPTGHCLLVALIDFMFSCNSLHLSKSTLVGGSGFWSCSTGSRQQLKSPSPWPSMSSINQVHVTDNRQYLLQQSIPSNTQNWAGARCKQTSAKHMSTDTVLNFG